MRKFLPQLLVVVNFSGKPTKALFVNVDLERIKTSNKDVNSQIIFQTIYKMGT